MVLEVLLAPRHEAGLLPELVTAAIKAGVVTGMAACPAVEGVGRG